MKSRFKAFLNNRIERPKAFVQVVEDKNEIFLYDEISYWGISADDFVQALNQTDPSKRLTVCINSPGGDIMDGVAITNLLIARGDVDVRIDGIAASIASVIAMAGENVQMADNATMMIHNPWTFIYGDAEELRKEADVLDTLKTTLVKTYRRHSHLSEEEIGGLMDADTWMTADEAKERGFITEIVNLAEPAESDAVNFDLSIYRNAPERFRLKKQEQPTNSGGDDRSGHHRQLFKLRHQINQLD